MIKKIRKLAQTINESKRRIIELEKKQLEIERFTLENYWANVFNSAIKGNQWMEGVSLNVGRWAGSYNLFYVLFRILNEIKPQNILELGLGETTKVIQAYKRFHNPQANCTTIEQNQEWIDFRLKNDISKETIKIVLLEVEKLRVHGKDTLAYKKLTDTIIIGKENRYNLVLIDGPWGSPSYSRYNIVEVINKDLLGKEFVIIMDDYNRAGEQETVGAIIDTLKKRGLPHVFGEYKGEKSVAIIASNCYNYLQSL